MATIQFQAFALNGFLSTITKTIAGRVRPSAANFDCENADVKCSADNNRSFFTGHTSYAFTGAGLICVEQKHLNLFGKVGGPIACGTALAFASLTGAFRVVGDKHWATDVLTGAGVGLFSGWLVPWLLHYRYDVKKEAAKKKCVRGIVVPFAQEKNYGLGYGGTF